eukprot:CAMPEP_0178427540 /NCGR_PEP_ID=MMETSP0689_2-20121128/29800_1 /TAXON_ID=160604 /ORGANISM="Amphidinium massartii, Strain CS-259" /LENGTH=653 /DNA_ID=CAMNT_0020049255 /DNA_START=64 /DNA_END=2022 /DNA_ORIENTATION=-
MVLRSADPSTLSEPLGPGRARAFHYDISWTIDFVGKRLIGHVDVKCRRNSEKPAEGESWELVLDGAENLQVTDVMVDGAATASGAWQRDEAGKHDVLGKAIRVKLPDGEPGSESIVRLFYQTAAPDANGEGGSSALQWLPPAQTSGKKFPYMFSQCQAIHARAMLPCQDTCECKASYTAEVVVPAELLALMSAEKAPEVVPVPEPDWEAPEGCGKQWMRHSFDQKVPLPPYLIAIVCANIEGKRVGPRTTVWSEPDMVEKSAWEFENTDAYLQAAEKYCGPYRWGVYDLLVLPPSFPYGGMENPCLTFVTPTLLAGDRSQEHIVAHEISHSWSGNLVTNETWEQFWLNEGLTVFTELKLVREVYGIEEAKLQCTERLKSMEDAIMRYGETHNFTRLVPDLKGGQDPDDAFSTVPYIKGMSTFSLLEKTVGGEEHFQPFIRSYFEKFAGSTVTSDKLRSYYEEYFKAKEESDPNLAGVSAKIAALDWETLLYSPGMPIYTPASDDGPFLEAKALAAKWLETQSAGREALQAAFSSKDIESWGSSKKCVFLDELIGDKRDAVGRMTEPACELMASIYGFLDTNCEVKCRFIRLGLGARWQGIVPAALDLATSQGRMKFTRPTFQALLTYDAELARSTFKKYRSCYHPICAKMVAR